MLSNCCLRDTPLRRCQNMEFFFLCQVIDLNPSLDEQTNRRSTLPAFELPLLVTRNVKVRPMNSETPDTDPGKSRRSAKAHARRVAIFVAGITVTAAGFAMLVLPGPGLLVIIAGLSILAIEFAWAARLRDQAKDRAKAAASTAGRMVGRKSK